ncbi:MAG: hypothetical protein COB89_00270 [Piscirickettsiaceae bacterium]|nr:MAG: hypothetical protein COB89_00270 [Piscirickettsiaceae bacterium]
MKALASFIMQGGRQATIVVASLAILSLLVPPVVIVSVAALCLITLRSGAAEGIRVIIGASVATALMGYVLLGTPMVSLTYLFVMWLPAFLVSLVLRETGKFNVALECLVLLGMVAVIGIYLMVDNPSQQWAVGIQDVVGRISQQQDLPVTQEEVRIGIEFWSQYITGIVIAGSLASLVMSLLLARWWQGLLYNPGGFSEEFSEIRLLPRDGMVFVALMLAAVSLNNAMGELLWNIDIPVLLLFLMVGMSVVQSVVKKKSKGRFFLIVFYVAVFFVPHLMLPIVLIGLSDVWMDWRQRFNKT